jgi:hypothetical protein
MTVFVLLWNIDNYWTVDGVYKSESAVKTRIRKIMSANERYKSTDFQTFQETVVDCI